MKVKLEDRFSDFELFEMFNVECDPNADQQKTRVRYIEEPYVFNDVKVPLLVRRKRKVSKRVRHYNDTIRAGVTSQPPGKGRVADLAKYYQDPTNEGVSPFEV